MKDRWDRVQKILRASAVIILVAGIAIAALIFWKNPRDVDDESDALSKRDIYQLEKLGGKEYVFSVEINSWLSSLWHGRRLAFTIIVIFSGASAICFAIVRHLETGS
jgi:hypothetical protein